MITNKLIQRYQSAKMLNDKLMSEIANNGGGATGLTATFAVNASKDLMKATRQIKNALNNGEISVSEYQKIFN